MPCLPTHNDQIITGLVAENFANETGNQAIPQLKSTRDIEGDVCNLSLVAGECFYIKAGAKRGIMEEKE